MRFVVGAAEINASAFQSPLPEEEGFFRDLRHSLRLQYSAMLCFFISNNMQLVLSLRLAYLKVITAVIRLIG